MKNNKNLIIYFPSIENGKYGYLFDIKDYKKLAYLMNHVIKNYSKAKKKIMDGRKTLYKYKVSNVALKYLNEIESLYKIK